MDLKIPLASFIMQHFIRVSQEETKELTFLSALSDFSS
jgi:hypothetical protein